MLKQMIKAIRRRLRLIRYYSAPRPDTVWTRATHLAVLLCLVLAVPSVWLADQMVIGPGQSPIIRGLIIYDDDGRTVGRITDRTQPGAAWAVAEPFGVFDIVLAHDEHGWPFATSRNLLPARVDLQGPADLQPRVNVQLPPGSPERTAIETALMEAEMTEALRRLRMTEPALHPLILAWVAGAMCWWLLLSAVVVVLIQTARIVFAVLHGKRLQRHWIWKREGRCTECGYDLYGLEFSERCPECGALVH